MTYLSSENPLNEVSDLQTVIETTIRQRLNRIINDLDYVAKIIKEMPVIRSVFKKELDTLKFFGIEL